MVAEISNKARQLSQIAIDYVNNGLGAKNFDNIPYDENVVLRAPLCPGGSSTPLIGKENLREHWWKPLPGLVGKVTLLDVYVNETHSKVAVEFHCEILQPSCKLRIIDRFKINEAGNIIEQENFFDPRAVTNPAS